MPVFNFQDPAIWEVARPTQEQIDANPGGWRMASFESRSLGQEYGWQTAVFPLGDDPEADDIPAVALLYLPPGHTLPRHTHGCHRMEIMLQGSLLMGERWLKPGDVWMSGPGEYYGPHVAGPTGSLSVEVFGTTAGMRARVEDGSRPDLSMNATR